MAALSDSPNATDTWSAQARAMAAQAKVLVGGKLDQLVVRLQRHTGRSKEACWRFVRQQLSDAPDHRRWTPEELEFVREALVKSSVDEVARKLKRSPKAVRSVLLRNHLSVREIRCDLFSVDSLAAVLHVRKSQIVAWIDKGWLPATVTRKGERNNYTITPDDLNQLYKNHYFDLLRSGRSNLVLFEAYVQYCHSPKHTTGEQLLNVRRDKRESAAFEEALHNAQEGDDDDVTRSEDEEDAMAERLCRADLEQFDDGEDCEFE